MIIPVKKILLIASREKQQEILSRLQETGMLEIRTINIKEKQKLNTESNSQIDYNLAQVKFALDFLTEHTPKQKLSLQKLLSPSLKITPKQLDEVIQSQEYLKIVEEVEKLEKQKNEILSQIRDLEEQLSQLYFWQSLDLIPNTKLNNVQIIIGTTETVISEDFKNTLQKITPNIEIKIINEQNQKTGFIIYYLKKEKDKIEKILQKFDFKEVFLDIQTTVQQKIREISQNITNLKKEQSKNKKDIEQLTQKKDILKITYDYLTWEKEKNTAIQKLFHTPNVFALNGWIAEENIPILEQQLKEITDKFAIKIIKPEKEEKPPIILKNSKLVTPFETITAIYGAPQYHDMDPTPYLTPFFILFFGLCLTDAGYGLILAILAYLFLKFADLEEKQKKLPTVLFYGGIVTFFAGALFGSWFGIDLNILPDPYKHWFKSIQIMDPINNPMPSLILAAVLGVIQIISATVFTFIFKLRNKDLKNAFLIDLPWLIFFATLAIFIFKKQIGIPEQYYNITTIGIYASLLLLVLTQGYEQKNIFLKLGSGLASLYNIVGYISDIISYSRIFALGLVTGIIAMVVNIIAMLFKDMIPYVGWIIAIVILIGGHIFNLAINSLSSFIHSGRLQFVEFFSKLIEGGGDWMKPFQKDNKFIKIVDENN